MMKFTQRASRSRRALRGLAVAGLVLPLAACDLDSILEVNDPDVVTPAILGDSAAIGLRMGGTLLDFGWGFSGSGATGGVVPYFALFTDEFYNPDTFDTRRDIDTRVINPDANGEASFSYRRLHRARIQARETAALVEQFEGKSSSNYVLARAIEGYSEQLLGEGWCSGVPFSQDVNGAIEYGEQLTTRQTFERALATFNDAIAGGATGDALNLARVGKARAQLALGDFAGAAATAAVVPNNFQYLVEHSNNSPNQENSVKALQDNGRIGVGVDSVGGVEVGESGNGRTVHFASNDPRTAWERDGEGFDGTTPLRVVAKYPLRTTDVVLASGLEARLIEAEAALAKGTSAAYLPMLNTLRAGVGLGALTDPGSVDGRVRQFFAERARFLFVTGHRLGDLRRMIQHYGYTQDQVFPTGAYHKLGIEYGTQTAFPIPNEERNNPNFDGCLANSGF